MNKNSYISAYASWNLNEQIRADSSSGGIFYSLAHKIIEKNGVVFGAAFNKKWIVEMRCAKTMDEVRPLMRSKYSQANLNNTFKEAEMYLKKGVNVLYIGTSCQIFALKKYLKIEYDNLLLVDVICHGVLPNKIWKDYLKSLKRFGCSIVDINFRDKSKRKDGSGGGWHDYNFRVEYSDGEVLSENHDTNKYMQVFLGDHYLKESCYNCKFKNENSVSDITIGDFWLVNRYHKDLDDNKGTSAVITRTQKGDVFFRSLTDIKYKQIPIEEIVSMGGGVSSTIRKKRKKYNNPFKKRKKVGIISIPLDMNPGGVIQSYVLENLIESFGYEATTISAHRLDYPTHLKFADYVMNIKMLPFSEHLKKVPYHLINKNEFDTIVVGSDQIWRRTEIDIKEIFLDFTKGWGINRFVYGASFGTSEWQYSEEDSKYVSEMLSKYFNGVSVREVGGVKNSRKYFNIKTELVLDPVFLCDEKIYLDLCKNIPTSESGIVCHILDVNQEKTDFINKISSKFNLNKMKYDKNSVESWLAAIRDSKFVITDSYHGCIFSIIFNKPFVCFYNEDRGASRFDTLASIFDIKNHFIRSETEINTKENLSLLTNSVVIPKTFFKLKRKSLKFLKNNLKKKAHYFERKPIIKLKIKESLLNILKCIFPKETRRGKVVRFIKKKFYKLFNK